MEKAIVIVILIGLVFCAGWYCHRPDKIIETETEIKTVVDTDTLTIAGKTVYLIKETTKIDTLTQVNTIVKTINVDASFDTLLIDSLATDSIAVRYRSLENIFNLSHKLTFVQKIVNPVPENKVEQNRLKMFAEVNVGNSILGLGAGVRYGKFDLGTLATSDKKLLIGLRMEIK